MTSKKNKARAPREVNKKFKKKTSVLVTEKVEYVAYGTLPGGRPCESYGYVPTHARTGQVYSVRERDDEMIVEADGFFWRFCEVGETSVEAIQAYERIEEMTWVGEPLDAGEAEPEAPRPF